MSPSQSSWPSSVACRADGTGMAQTLVHMYYAIWNLGTARASTDITSEGRRTVGVQWPHVERTLQSSPGPGWDGMGLK